MKLHYHNDNEEFVVTYKTTFVRKDQVVQQLHRRTFETKQDALSFMRQLKTA